MDARAASDLLNQVALPKFVVLLKFYRARTVKDGTRTKPEKSKQVDQFSQVALFSTDYCSKGY